MAILTKQTNMIFTTLPSEYQEVEWIKSIDHAYIVPAKITSDIGFEITANIPTGTNGCLIGNYLPGNYFFFVYSYTNNTTTFFPSKNASTISMSVARDSKVTFSFKNGVLDDGTTQTTVPDYATYEVNQNLYLFSGLSTQWFTSYTLYKCKIYNGSTVVRDLIPCYRKADNEIGLYDIVNDVFYPNANSVGYFEKGNDVNSYKIKRYKAAFLNQTNNLLKLYRTEWGTESKNPTDPVTFDYNKMYYMAGSGYIRPNPGTLNEELTRTSVKYTQSTSTWWGIGFPMEVKPNTKYTISGSRSEGTITKFVYTLYDNDGMFENYAQVSNDTAELNPHITITTGANTKTLVILVCGITSDETIKMWDIQVEEGQTQTTFKPYLYEESRRKVNLLSN